MQADEDDARAWKRRALDLEAQCAQLLKETQCTMRELACLPLPALPQDPAPASKTPGVSWRTFSEVRYWLGFEEKVQDFISTLDHTVLWSRPRSAQRT